MDLVAKLHSLGVSLAIGLLIGIERHWRYRDEGPGQRTAGVRSFGICGLLGGIAASIGTATPQAWAGMLLLGLCFLGLSAAIIRFQTRESIAEGSFSVTTVLVAQATFLLGALAVLGDLRVAAATAVALTAMLSARETLHALVAKLSWQELRSGILLLSMTLIVLPIIPNRRLEWLGGFNPARIWSYAIILAAISFVGYAAVRVLGERRGRLLAGAAAGLASSTAAVLTNARAARTSPPEPLAAGALVASSVSYARTAAIAVGIAPLLGTPLLASLLAAAVVKAAVAVLVARRPVAPGTAPTPLPKNPFELLSVLQIALLLSVIGIAADQATRLLGNAGLYVVAAISGLADVDAVTLSATSLLPDHITRQAATVTILIGVLSNTAAKAAYAFWFGSLRFGRLYGLGSLIAMAAGAGALFATGLE